MTANRPEPVLVPEHVARFVVRLLADRERMLAARGITPHGDQISVRRFLAAALELPHGDAAGGGDDNAREREWITTAEAARLIGVTDRTVRRYVDRKFIEGRRLGRDLFVDRDDAESFAARGTR